MDSYNLFGDDGSGMLEELNDLGGSDSFAGSTSSGVASDNKDNTDNSYRQSYPASSVPPEGTIQKLASFGSNNSQPVSNPGGPPPTDYHEYGAYPPRPRMPQPPHAPIHPSHHVHPSHAYPGYHPGPEPMYAMPEQGIGEMGVWSSAPGANRYAPIAPGYRHSYEHQQKMHQYAPQQATGIGSLQAQNTGYIPRQPHFSQPSSQQLYAQQGYPNYTQMHPPTSARISQHPSYHQQMEVNSHQYGLSHGQQTHSALAQHQSHQAMSSHTGPIGPGLQGHPNPHLHHGGPPLHHVPRQPIVSSSSVGTNHPSQMPFASPHHSVPMNYQPHQVQHPLDVNVTNQYGSVKPSLETGSPQYRPPFPQLSPQMSPRAQMSPRQQPQSQPQVSPRPVMSPVKGPSASPHSARSIVQSPASGPPPVSTAYTSQNTLQALEQMVLPTNEYQFQRNQASPAISHNISSAAQWNQSKIATSINNSNIMPIDTSDHSLKVPEAAATPEINKSISFSSPLIEKKEAPVVECDKKAEDSSNSQGFMLSNTLHATSNTKPPPITLMGQSSVLSENDDPKENLSQVNEGSEDLLKIETSANREDAKNDITTNKDAVVDEDTKKVETKEINDELIKESRQTVSQTSVNIDTPTELATNVQQLQPPLPPMVNKFETSPLNMDRTFQHTYQNIPSMLSTGLPGNLTMSIPNPMQNSSPISTASTFKSVHTAITKSETNLPLSQSLQPPNISTVATSSMPIHSAPSNINCVQLGPSIMNIQTSVHNTPTPNNTLNQAPPNVQVGIPMGGQNIHPSMSSHLPTNQPNMLQPVSHPNIIIMGSNNVGHPTMPPLYAASHHQERAALQQQIQEIYCLPPSSENQEKVRCLQERLSMLQQHETNDKCSGGPNCILQNPIYGSKMVESPQVTSTTGRGRGKGPAKPRKPRAKKDKMSNLSQSLAQLPVSEDCVTAGTGLQGNTEIDAEIVDESLNLDSSAILISDAVKTKKVRGPRKNKERKPRTPKEPKIPKDTADKPVKERKKRVPKDPNTPRRKRNVKRGISEFQADTTTGNDILEKDSMHVSANDVSINNSNLNDSMPTVGDLPSLDDSNVTDFDDIPVSKIAIKDLLDEAEAKKEQIEIDDDFDSLGRKKSKKRSSAGGSGKKLLTRRTPAGKRKRRGGLIPDSDGEPDDLASTPPPSPPLEGDDSLKRRSARHTQRKKYTDDVMLRLSDEEFSMTTARQEKDFDDSLEMKDINRPEGTPKPNYMYVNTTDEDSMIVQHVLACRMGKRQVKPETQVSVQKDLIDIENNKKETSLGTENVDVTNNENQNNCEEPQTSQNKQEITTPVVEPANMKTESNNIESDKTDDKPIIVDVEEYYVKYRNFSYLHCEWKTEEELYKGDKRIFSKIKRFKQKQAQQMNIFELLDDEPFNPDYIEVERILDMSENQDPANNTVVKHYLVKWKSLQYEDSTWELEEDIDVDKITQYKIFSELPPKEKWKFKKRPCPDLWTQLKESPLYKGGNTLRPYQLEGLNWLLFSWHNNRNCILADEMGLGKTIQSLTFVNAVWEYGIRGPFLIIAPLSTIPNWQREFEAWTDMNVIVYHGSQQSKSMIQEYEFFYKNENGEPNKEITKFNVLITTFEIIVTDFQELRSFNWRICVIDEAHRLKNRNCKLLEGLRQLHLEHRVLLSGTPLQNNVNELFSLLNFLEPSQFSSSDAFLTEFGQLKTESEVLKLQALLKPMMLRRLKEDVEKTLAPKEETIIEVELTNIQKKYYRAILERNFSFLQKGISSAANIPNLMNTMMELRKCCIHPYLLNGAEEQIQFDYKQTYGEDKEAYYEAIIQSSGKMVLVDKLLPKLKAGGHRVLIFSQMVRCLDILEDYLVFRKYPYERIDGRIRGNLRQEAIDRFSKPDSDRFVFLLCTKAGGLGINLTAADTVIIYDSDWNPQNDLQAQARCHRIGQLKMVKIYRLICRNTYEREMFDKASLKLGLDKAILQSMNTSQGKETGLKQLSKKEIEDLLKKGAYGAVMDEDNAGDKFCEEDIEMILARRTQIIQMESEKGSTFSKASFAATDQRSDIDIRDPDFWNKWAKKAEIDTTEKKEDEDLIVTEPRKRTIIKRYGHDDGPMEMSDMEVTPDSEEDEDGVSLRSKKKKDKFGRKGRRYGSDDYVPRHEGVPVDEEVVYGSWTRSECFKIERGLLTFGWARWEEVVDRNQLRKGWTIPVIEDCARIIVLFCLRHYKGDEKIRNFIWDLIEPCENGEVTISRNHSGLHNPVPRGRNAKKKNRVKDIPKQHDLQKWEDGNHWSSEEKYDCEAYLESSYKKHLFRHANKVLLRVRMMYYIKHEVIGDYAAQIDNGTHASTLGMRVPRGVDSAPPRLWWDTECDISLLVGTYKHGYENYLAMRSDPQLCYVEKLGPPDDAECTDIKSEERKVRGSVVGDEDCTDDVSSGAATSPRPDDDPTHPWPSMQDLNTRLRRLITAYQRNYKREELKMQQRAKMERRERMDQLVRDEVSQWRWTRADEEAFRRTVASYGVEFDPSTKSLRWNRFRSLARLDSKSDDALTDYLKAFMAMCKRQCGLSVGEAELPTRADLKAEPIGEERAIATLERIDLLRVLREEVAPHPALEARLALCERAHDTPPWWQPASHDKYLVLGVCKHGLGDTFTKLFCDTKMPFADSARKWYSKYKASKVEKQNSDDEEKSGNRSENSTETRMSLRRSKRTSTIPDRDADDDTDALSELENLAKLGRIEESLSPEQWFTERALETRLHHIAHAVQNCEWPAVSTSMIKNEENAIDTTEDRKQPQKRHIAIDVETERAKLHALLSSPQAAHTSVRDHRTASGSANVAGSERDDASSDSGSRRSTPAPPPAHQRVAPSPAPSVPPSPSPSASAPVDLSAPLDLSEAQDFSMGRRTPQSEPSPAPPARSRLDDTLNRLMKRKNVPAQEQIVGKEKKRKKLDEIVLGLSAAKVRGPSSSALNEPPKSKNTTILPEVTVTPAAPPSSSAQPLQKPFSVTVTNVPSPHTSSKELSSFLQQSLEQSKTPKNTPPVVQTKPFSHEAKVNKWLAEQATVDNRRRGVAPRLSPDEHVPVVHRVSGKRLVGHKAPQLKHLAQWIAENPMYDIDAKWTEGIKEHVKLPQDVRSQRHSPMQTPTSMPERKKGRPPTLDSPSTNVLSGSHMNQNLAGLNPALLASLSSLSAFDPKTLAATLSNLTGFDPKLLSSLSSFDPKNNPLLNSFSGMPNLLGNMAGSNIFANLAGLGLPGFSSLDMNSLGGNPSSNSGESKSKSRKPESTSTSSSKSSSSQFPFVFPNPNMLYPQLGLGGLSPFGVHPGMSSPYDALGLLSGNLSAASSAATMHSSSRSSTKTSTPRSSTVVTPTSTSRQKVSDRQQSSNLPQILLPPDPYLLESISKQTLNYDSGMKSDKRTRDSDLHEAAATDLSKMDKKKIQYSMQSQMPPEFAAVQEKLLKGDKKDIDISKMLLEQMASGALSASLVSSVETKKNRDEKEYDKFMKQASEYMPRHTNDDANVNISLGGTKRVIDETNIEPENLAMQTASKRLKESKESSTSNRDKQQNTPTHTGEMDLEDLIAPSTVIKTGIKGSDYEMNRAMESTHSHTSNNTLERNDTSQSRLTSPNQMMQYDDNSSLVVDCSNKFEGDHKADSLMDENGDSNNADNGRKASKKKTRKSSDENLTCPRRELRSSSTRQSFDSSPIN
ncbi:chromodomain-helicase-DNA-binding protein 7-like [Leptidea sinapis]|uniref:chromodomain-helicase-DNA-binding protein 7-like n=1 Tax=Leptidea sinapis TaxID=189913 RepID=UPI00212F0501|nr:chromodomain-helicase-DNA-binding protein 7-like [Leptidea sinapis]